MNCELCGREFENDSPIFDLVCYGPNYNRCWYKNICPDCADELSYDHISSKPKTEHPFWITSTFEGPWEFIDTKGD